jgi:hypothetical protein
MHDDQEHHEKRTLTDEDIHALAKALKTEFYSNLGKGVWALAWKVVVWTVAAVAVYGSLKGLKI